MKNKLQDLGLPEKVVDEILSVFELYEKSCECLSKPKGKQEFDDHISEIISLTGKLSKRLGKLTRMERQLLDRNCPPGCFEIRGYLNRLSWAAKQVKGQHFRSARRPFILELAANLRSTLEASGVQVTLYRQNPIVQVLGVLFEKDLDCDWSFNLVRQLLK